MEDQIKLQIQREKALIRLIKLRNKRNVRRICATMGLYLPMAAYQWLGNTTIASAAERRLNGLEMALNINEVM